MTSIYIAAHKPLSYDIEAPYVAVYVGEAATRNLPGLNPLLGEVEPDNAYFCELTAQYRVWKHVMPTLPSNVIVGFCHYRRFFTFDKTAENWDAVRGIKAKEIIADAFGKDCDVILPEPVRFEVQTWRNSLTVMRRLRRLRRPGVCLNLTEQYRAFHNKTDMETGLELLPVEHRSGFEQYLKTEGLSLYNMYIARCSTVDAYFSLMFPWLLALGNHIDLETRDTYQKRALAFLSERFASYYFMTHHKPSFSRVSLIQV
jgi:hypothetical protein